MPSLYVFALIASLIFFGISVIESGFKSWISWGLLCLALAQLLYGK